MGGDEVSGLGTQCPLFRKSYVGVAIRLKVVRPSRSKARQWACSLSLLLACQSSQKRFHGGPPCLAGYLRRGVKDIGALRPDRIIRAGDQIGVACAIIPCAHNHPVG